MDTYDDIVACSRTPIPIPSVERLQQYQRWNPDAPRIIIEAVLVAKEHKRQSERKRMGALRKKRLGMQIGVFITTLLSMAGLLYLCVFR